MFSAKSRVRNVARVGVVVAALAMVFLVTLLATGLGSSVRGTVELRSLPRFGELVPKTDRATDRGEAVSSESEDETGAEAGSAQTGSAQTGSAQTGSDVAAPPTPSVDRSAFSTAAPPEADAQWRAGGAKPILHLQRNRSADVARVDGPSGTVAEVVVTDLSPRNGIAYLAEIRPAAGSTAPAGGPWHLHNADPAGQLLRAGGDGLVLVSERGEEECLLWPGADPSIMTAALSRGRELGAAWMPLCGQSARVFLRLPVTGRKTHKEWTTDLLRDNLPAGEQITVLVRQTLFADSELRVGLLGPRADGARDLPGAPPPVAVDPRWSDLTTPLGDFGLQPAEAADGRVPVGRWLPLADRRAGVWVSLFQPRLVDERQVHDPRNQPLDEVERSSMVYLVAFDLEDHDLSFVLGTDHPRLGWSERVPKDVGDRSKPGPDGFADGAPLVRTGQVPLWRLADLQAAFTGGFKRSHGAFKRGELARRRDGSHYGFVEDGVVWSKPVPGLATVTVWDDGRVDLHTWSEQDDGQLARVRQLRQNGVPLLAPETTADGSTEVRVGQLVGRWGEGNWSGSQDQKLRSVRAGLCIIESRSEETAPEETAPAVAVTAAADGPPDAAEDMETGAVEAPATVDRHLVYGWFSAGTPSGMAKVFLAYHCRYAMLLDMNALEHTYLSILTPTSDERPIAAGALRIEHLVRGMEVLDETYGGVTLPRFAGFADNRDFFYLTRRSGGAQPEAPDAPDAPDAGTGALVTETSP